MKIVIGDCDVCGEQEECVQVETMGNELWNACETCFLEMLAKEVG
jgi:hypothetical protein